MVDEQERCGSAGDGSAGRVHSHPLGRVRRFAVIPRVHTGGVSSDSRTAWSDRVTRAASDYAMQLIGRTLDDSFGRMARASRGSFLQITYRSKPFYPAPLPEVDEERLVRERACEQCALRYAVFGEHRFCLVCGLLAPLVAALDALAAETVRLDALDELPSETRRRLHESGVLDRTYADTIENVAGIVEAMAERTFRQRVANADQLLKGRGKVFQRLDDFANLFQAEARVDVRTLSERCSEHGLCPRLHMAELLRLWR